MEISISVASSITVTYAKLCIGISWLIDKKGELKKENFDACDAYVACLGMINKEKYGDVEPIATNINVEEDKITYDVNFWGKVDTRVIYFDNRV